SSSGCSTSRGIGGGASLQCAGLRKSFGRCVARAVIRSTWGGWRPAATASRAGTVNRPRDVQGIGARRAALKLLDAVLRRGETLDQAAATATAGLPTT